MLELQPDIYGDNPPLTFTGHVQVWFECKEATDLVVLNSVRLTITEGSLEVEAANATVTPPVVEGWELEEEVQFLKVHLQTELVVGEVYVLRVSFAGTLSPSHEDQGLFWDSYPQGDNTRCVRTQHST